ncbi:hypothetical protein GCM10008927_23460 [Amylibacter ulvae]|uniref:Uncharacterized protein n=1 Tax=Paramylibacter ulvae TaxID=1651968 RepID=A0ABQ3D4F2_9RHOB|nr:hypothetical protein [Amylibacter ulvae]GHA57099.1 hypothetical protein GCM10008927_23460 [Amylibacter ulvae]
MALIYRSFLLGLTGFPFVAIVRFFYEIVWGIGTAIISAVVIVLAMAVPPLGLILIVPFSVYMCAIMIGALRPILTMARYPSEFGFGLMMQQIMPMVLLRLAGYLLLILLVAGGLVIGFGLDFIIGVFERLNAETATTPEDEQFYIIAFAAFYLGMYLVESILAVPTAASAYASGEEGAYIPSIFGLGYRWPMIFVLFVVWELAIFALLGVTISAFSGGISGESLRVFFASYFNYNPAYNPEGVVPSNISPVAFFGCFIVYYYLRISFWAGTCGAAFREKMLIDGNVAAQTRPDPIAVAQKQEERITDIRALRQQRMNKD